MKNQAVEHSTEQAPGPAQASGRIKPFLLFVATAVLATGVVWLFSPGSPLPWLSKSEKSGQPGSLLPYQLLMTENVDPEAEIAFYRQRISQNPEGFLDLVSLADAYLRRAKATGEAGWYLLAEQAARRSLASFEYNPGALLILTRIAIARHDFNEALKLTSQAQKIKRDDLGIQSSLVTIRLGLGDPAAAALAAEQLVKRAPGLESYTQRALVYVAQGRDEAAIQDLKHGISLEMSGQMESSAQARAWLGRLYARGGQPDIADALYTEALRIRPRHAVTLGLLADLDLRKSRFSEAESHYREAFEASQAPVYLIGRARAQQAQNQLPESEALWQAAEKTLRREVDASGFGHRRDLARLLLERKTAPAEALSLMQAEIKQRQDAETLNILAWSLSANQRWPEARTVMQRLLATGAHEAEYLYRAALIEKKLNQPEKARAFLSDADRRDPGFRADPAYTAIHQALEAP